MTSLNMNKYFLGFLGGLVVFSLFPAGFAASPCVPDSNNKCVELSGAQKASPCSPPRSNDCTIVDATVVSSGEIAPLWQGLKIEAKNLPPQSWYRVEKSTDDEYVLVVYPNVGEHYLLGRRDFEINIEIRKTQKTGKVVCTAVPFEDSLGDRQFENGPFHIEVKHRLNYFYDGGPGSNPNPYTREVSQILKKVIEGIKIGDC
ncbi:MAG: hypothetical protein HY541_07760 [Deltaproteobacteria bacterium]|nr:hypothetical protein [Deltaproteobacteria bacterium]